MTTRACEFAALPDDRTVCSILTLRYNKWQSELFLSHCAVHTRPALLMRAFCSTVELPDQSDSLAGTATPPHQAVYSIIFDSFFVNVSIFIRLGFFFFVFFWQVRVVCKCVCMCAR